MEIKSINTTTKISNVHTAAKSGLEFDKDEILYAKIVSIDGETITLKTRDDTLFTAKILSGLELSVGDDLRLIVKGRQGGKFVMQALDINPDQVEILSEGTQQSEESKLILTIVNLFKKYGLEPTNGKVNEIITAMEKNPGLSVKAAVFMAANEMAFTEEQIEAIRQLESGSAKISNDLLDLLGSIVLNEAFPESKEGQNVLKILSENLVSPQPEAQAHGAHIPDGGESAKALNISVDPQRNFYTITSASAGHSSRTFAEAAAQPAQSGSARLPGEAAEGSEAVRQAEGVKSIITRLFENGGKTETENAQNFLPAEDSGAVKEQDLFQSKAVQDILTKIVDMFARTKDGRADSEIIKNDGERKISELAELKQMLKNSDIKNRDELADRIDKTLSQNKVISEINRYTLMHIPVNMGPEQQTAEIYIYRNRKKAGKADPQEIKILIGLDTVNLGRFEVLVTAKGKNLSIQMARGDDRANEVIGLRVKSLKKTFSELGYNLSDFKIERLREKTTPANAEEVLMGGISPSSFKINYTI